MSVAQAARDLDVHENLLRKWVKQLADDPLEAFPGHGKMKAAEAEIAAYFYSPKLAIHRITAGCHVIDAYGNHVTAAQFAVDGQVEQGGVTLFALHLAGPAAWPRQWILRAFQNS